MKILGGNIEDIISFEIPDTDMARTILKIHKTKQHQTFSKESWFTIKGTNLLKGFTFISDGYRL